MLLWAVDPRNPQRYIRLLGVPRSSTIEVGAKFAAYATHQGDHGPLHVVWIGWPMSRVVPRVYVVTVTRKTASRTSKKVTKSLQKLVRWFSNFSLKQLTEVRRPIWLASRPNFPPSAHNLIAALSERHLCEPCVKSIRSV